MSSAADLMRTSLYDVAIGERLELIDEIAALDMVDEANTVFGGPEGRAGLVAHVRGFRKHIQDCQIEVHRIVGASDEVMAWWGFEGLHIGPWLGKKATHQAVKGTVFSHFEVRDGLIERYRLYLNAEFTDAVAIFDTSLGLKPTFIGKTA